MKVLARRTITTSGTDIEVEVVATGNGPFLMVKDCPSIPLSEIRPTHRILSRFGRAGEGEGLTPTGEMLLAVLGELA